MGKHPNLTELDYLFESGSNFQLPGKLYEEKTGTPLPKNNSYLKNSSALAARAKERGYVIDRVEEKAVIERILILKKRG